MEIGDGFASDVNLVEARILTSTYLGSRKRFVVALGGTEWQVETPVDASFAEGETVKLRLAPERIWLLPGDGAEPPETAV